MADEELELRLHMAIRPDWRNADILRTAVLTCVKAVSVEGGGDDESMIGTVASELVENAIKYGKWDDARTAPLEVRVSSNGEWVEIAVSNPTDAAHFGELRRTLEWIRSFPSAEEAYLARMKTVLDQGAGGSRMGLVRILHEARCSLTEELSEDQSRVTLKAMARFASD